MTTNPETTLPPAEPAETITVTGDARNWATLSHLSAYIAFFGIPPLVGPLVMWLIRRDDPYAEYHAKEALNFNISFVLYGIASAILILAVVGLLLLPIVLVTWFVLVIRGAVKASSGQYYRYPMTLRFVS